VASKSPGRSRANKMIAEPDVLNRRVKALAMTFRKGAGMKTGVESG